MTASIVLFGFANSIFIAIVARGCIGLTGNVGILRTIVAELVPDPDLKLQALGLLPMAWNIGTISGPALGGLLSEPAQKYPSLFQKDGFFDRHPFVLPNLFIASLTTVACILAILFLDETLEERKDLYDPGRELGKRIELFFGFSCSELRAEESPQLCTNAAAIDEEAIPKQPKNNCDEYRKTNKALSLSEILTPQSVYLVILFFIAGLHRVTAEQLLSLFLATRVHNKSNPIRLPFHIPGGFGLNSSQIGLIFAASGAVEILIQVFIYAPMARKYGNRRLLVIAAITDPIVYLIIPYLLALYDPPCPTDGGGGSSNLICYTVWALILVMVCANSVLGLNSVVIMVTDSANSPKALSTLNGFATSVVSVGIAIGPTTFGFLYSVGQKSEWTTIPWVGLAIVASAMWIWIPKLKDRKDSKREDGGDGPAPIGNHSLDEDHTGDCPQMSQR
ncbi:Major facilitator superfamily multidrug transporter [Drechslerella dactyloides]|uniref:Major facilitator superfamily multidrug transporter n=1 Tax=Drechslerella dactyloides TaxID=74499 RepID=A0AAD6NMS6_DREDA|nr:Major facilitator superfamily multidrug transporter [Drechslerella dactyloides]